MGSWLYGWIFDHWGANVAGTILILFVVLYLYGETVGSFSFARQKSTMHPNNNNSELNIKSSSPESTTTLSYLESAKK